MIKIVEDEHDDWLDISTLAMPSSIMKIWSSPFLAALLICGIISETSAAPLELITASEADSPNLSCPKDGSSGGPAGFHARTPTPGGPQIIVEKPEQGSSVPTPFPVRVRFVPSPVTK